MACSDDCNHEHFLLSQMLDHNERCKGVCLKNCFCKGAMIVELLSAKNQ